MSGRSFLLLSRFRPDRPAGGAALRNWQNIQALAKLGTVDVITINGHDRAGETVPPVRHWRTVVVPLAGVNSAATRWRARLRWLWPGVHPAVDQYRYAPATREIARHLSHHRYDVAIVEELSLAAFLPLLKQAGCRVVFDAHNVESVLRAELENTRGKPRTALQGAWRRWRHQRLTAEEAHAVRSADLVWACSEVDAHQLRALFRPQAPVAVVPNGLEIESYRSRRSVPSDQSWTDHPVTLAYLGSYSYSPNEQAALTLINDVLPAFRARGVEARLLLIGRDPTPAMYQAAGDEAAITITGAVPSILPYLEKPCVVTLPLHLGSGTRLKILEAFAADRPVVSTRKGAEGLDVVDGQHVLLREHPPETVDAVLQLWSRTDLRAALCRESSRLLAERYSWSACAQNIARSLEPSAVIPVHATAAASMV